MYLALAKIFLFCVVVFMLAFHPTAEQGKVSPKAEYLMTITWDSTPDADVDSWLKMPDGYIICYRETEKVTHKEHELVTLERDDLGAISDVVDGVDQLHREETITWRAIVPGDYTINLHLFRYHVNGDADSVPDPSNKSVIFQNGYDLQGVDTGKELPKPLHATITFERLNPTVNLVKVKNFTFTVARQELFGFRFRILPNGQVVAINEDSPISVLTDLIEADQFVPPEGSF